MVLIEFLLVEESLNVDNKIASDGLIEVACVWSVEDKVEDAVIWVDDTEVILVSGSNTWVLVIIVEGDNELFLEVELESILDDEADVLIAAVWIKVEEFIIEIVEVDVDVDVDVDKFVVVVVVLVVAAEDLLVIVLTVVVVVVVVVVVIVDVFDVVDVVDRVVDIVAVEILSVVLLVVVLKLVNGLALLNEYLL